MAAPVLLGTPDYDAAGNGLSVDCGTPDAGKLLVAFELVLGGNVDASASSSVSGGGLIWAKADPPSGWYSSPLSWDPCIAVWTAVASGAALTVSAAANGAHRHGLAVVGADGTGIGAVGEAGGNAWLSGSRSVTFGTAPDPSRYVVAAILMRDWSSSTITPSGTSLHSKANGGAEADELHTAVQYLAGLDATTETIWANVDGNSLDGQGYYTLALEITEGSPPVEHTGSGAATMGAFTASGTGVRGITGTGAATMGAFVGSGYDAPPAGGRGRVGRLSLRMGLGL